VSSVLQIGYYFQSCLGSVFPPLALEAATSLLKICMQERRPSSPGVGCDLAVATAWAPLAVATLIELWDKKSEPSSGASYTQLLSIIAGSIKCLQVGTDQRWNNFCSGGSNEELRREIVLLLQQPLRCICLFAHGPAYRWFTIFF